jgi:hypothetical protein
VKRTRILSTLLAALALLTASCGTSDYLESVTLTSNGASAGGFFNLAGVDGTLQLIVTANYHSGKKVIVTNDSTWTVTPVGTDDTGTPLPPYGPNTVPISRTGLMTGIAQICTWTDAIDNTKTPPAPANPPVWEYTGYYQTTATYRNFTSQPVGIGVGVTASLNSPVGGCGPT